MFHEDIKSIVLDSNNDGLLAFDVDSVPLSNFSHVMRKCFSVIHDCPPNSNENDVDMCENGPNAYR